MALRSAPALSSRPPHARNARVAFNESLARRDTVSHCRAAAKDVGRTMMQQRVESGEAAADDRQFKCVALGLGG